jgi:hypothetical protein
MSTAQANTLQPIVGPAAWKGPAIADDPAWVHRFTAAEIAELDRAIKAAKASGKPLGQLTREDFDLPSLAPVIRGWMKSLNRGRGFVLVKGFPVFDYTTQDLEIAYWGLGRHMGDPVPQNRAGDLLGHVRDTGEIKTNPKVRLYKTTKRQDFHADGSDIVGLFCLRRAKSGGLSQIVSSISIYNEFVRRRPDLVPLLFEPLTWDRAGEYLPGEKPYMKMPIAYVANGHIRMFYIGWYIRDGQQYPEVPRFTTAQSEMLDLIEEIANDPAFHLTMDFEPGDIQFLKNSTILHCRTEYEDFDEPEKKRHLLRLWLTAREFEDGDERLRQGFAKGEVAQ